MPLPRIPRHPEPSATGAVTIAASAEAAYGIISDPPVMTGLAEEAHGARWLGSAGAAAVGARFVGHNRRGRLRRWSTVCTVTDAEPGRRFAFEVTATPLRIPISRWEYTIEPAAGGGPGCRVTETSYLRAPVWFLPVAIAVTGVLNRPDANTTNIARTLDRLKARLESAPSPAAAAD
ncbi:SRPBCC family protein [Streptomyces sp. NPDC089919]|uniref:SRPBCC family protein n=1 Tax=Streptomyces sp. NPDC089919 TaxID=3155188 RepID=UPI0034470914